MSEASIRQMDKGYLIEDKVVSSSECNELIECLSIQTKKNRAGLRNLMKIPTVQSIAMYPRLVSIAQRFVGPSAIPYRATLFAKSGRANWLVVWHQDTALPLQQRFESADWGPWSLKEGINYAHAPSWALARIIALRIHLDESTELNGPLRVIPQSHSFGVLKDDEVLAHAHNNLPVACLAKRGSVVAMRPLLIHASSKAQINSPRRVLHIECADSLQFEGGIRLAIA